MSVLPDFVQKQANLGAQRRDQAVCTILVTAVVHALRKLGP